MASPQEEDVVFVSTCLSLGLSAAVTGDVFVSAGLLAAGVSVGLSWVAVDFFALGAETFFTAVLSGSGLETGFVSFSFAWGASFPAACGFLVVFFAVFLTDFFTASPLLDDFSGCFCVATTLMLVLLSVAGEVASVDGVCVILASVVWAWLLLRLLLPPRLPERLRPRLVRPCCLDFVSFC